MEKAEGDSITAQREFRARKAPNYDATCFHAQQSAEKYLKAILQEYGRPIPRIHDLAELLALILKDDPTFILIQADLNVLESYAVQFRYPGLTADKAEAKAALSAAKQVHAFVRDKLGL